MPAIPFSIEADEDVAEDKPQTKADATFLKATALKLTSACQVVEHILKADGMKDVDEGRIVSAIRQLDGRTAKILQAGFTKMRGQVASALKQLRAFSELMKAVKSFEGKLRVTAKQLEAAAGMAAAFAKFEDCNFDYQKLPWFIGTA